MPSIRSFLAATFALGLLDQAVSRTIKPSSDLASGGLASGGLDPAKDIAARDPAYQNWDQECIDNFNNYNPDDRRDINGCESWTMRWEGGATGDGIFITAEEKATGSYIRFYVDDCVSPDFVPDPYQCVSPGGRCNDRPSGTYIAG
ncbi:uncharacterized protein J7T54_007416 [Emericellopsis cladophorae]|uniref:Uncharacterized protein n=1 Tax=Emericellopsis cladophorae TaxID=2686198 RepID=A0A9P9XV89_9HYPO|nr:uncharacterized protein J7T54_007416 [Emericellopsis cladophorae]KAI6778019.1 hypothetical protein J7T54_007416 [Emericellopsis cladophorae]